MVMPQKSKARKAFGVYKGHQHPVRKAFRTNFRALRIAADETSYKLAEELGVSQGWVSELESAKDDKTPDLFMLYRIAAHFAIPVHTLLIPDFYNAGIDLDCNIAAMTKDAYEALRKSLTRVVDRARSKLGAVTV
jgi:transcriptional regulator with XRE-family HTH domain